MTDPFAVLGLDRSATLEQVRVARRTLARTLHPDVGGDAGRMQEVNAAFEAAVAHLTGRRPLPGDQTSGPAGGPRRHAEPAGATPSPPGRGPAASAGDAAAHSGRAGAGWSGRRERSPWRPSPSQRVQHDVPSFTIDALPAEAFEALLVVASWIGEVAVDDPPYLLEARLDEPVPCWCRLDLVPDAGASTVSLTVVFDLPIPDGVDAETVRDTWVANLNHLGREAP